MEFRNPRLIRDNAIECEVNHPDLGWIPFGAVAGEPGLPGEVFAAALPLAVDLRDPDARLTAERAAMTVSRFQARAALRAAGYFDAASTAIAQSNDPVLQEAWDSATEFRRMSPSIMAIGAALGLGDSAIDDLFRQAATITA